MKRKLVKHGPSSFIVSLPAEWIKKNNLGKGDAVEVSLDRNSVIIQATEEEKLETASIDMKKAKDATPLIISSLFQRGIDEIRINYRSSEDLKMIYDTLSRESIGYDIVETSKHHCILRNITRLTKEFNSLFHTVLRRSFMVTLSLADEGIKAIKDRDFDALENLTILSHSNKKLTSMCRRYMNKYSIDHIEHIGPLYYIVHLLDKIGDQYIYLLEDAQSLKKEDAVFNSQLIDLFTKLTKMLRTYYECFYKFDMEKLILLKNDKNEFKEVLKKRIQGITSKGDMVLYHNAVTLSTRISGLIEPMLVLFAKEEEQNDLRPYL